MALRGYPPPQFLRHGEEVGVQLPVSRTKYTYLHSDGKGTKKEEKKKEIKNFLAQMAM
jgi:hypothetical protein